MDNIQVSEATIVGQDYDGLGRISKNNVGNYNYKTTAKPFQNTSVDLNSQASDYFASRSNLDITYNVHKCPIDIIEEGKGKISFIYNINNSRSTIYYGSLESDKLLRPFRNLYSADGSMEIKRDLSTDETEFIFYIGGDACTAPVILKSDGNTQNYVYLYRDYLGSILAITNEEAAIVEQRHFDAWGNIAHVADGNGNALDKLTFFDRGYTGHEHLQGVVLIHMNGRLYDPKLHRFLQPDNFVQQPDNTQNYNRYAYCLNNPLKYNDPSGDEALSIGAVIAISAAVAFFTYTATAFLSDVPFTLQGVVQTVVMASFTAAVTFGIGSATAGIKCFALRATTQAVAHGTFNGAMSGIQGGKFWNGFAAGAASSAAASLFSGGNNLGDNGLPKAGTGYSGVGHAIGMDNAAGMIAFGTIAGGAGAHLSGGNFWQGAVTGLIVSGLNHAAHQGNSGDEDPIKKFKSKIGKIYKKFENNIKQNYRVAKPILRNYFNAAEIVGGTAEITGFLGLGMSEGTSSLLMVQGAKMSFYGTDGNVVLDLIDNTPGSAKSATYRIVKFAAFAGAGSAIEKIPYAPAKSLINAVKGFSDTYISPALEDSWSKFVKN